jgi:hypothetical protein
MRTFIPAIAAMALALPAVAQEDFRNIDITIGVLQRDSDTNSSKFLEYRDIPQGAVIPLLRLQGKKGDFTYNFQAKDVTQDDQRYFLRLGTDDWKLRGDYTGVPHNFGNGGKSLLLPTRENDWQLSNTVQAAYQAAVTATGSTDYSFLSRLVQPGLDAAPANIDLRLTRDRGNLSLDFTPGEGNLDIGVSYLHERRSGTRAANGTSFGFSNVIETPEPLRYITQDFGVHAAYKGDWGSAQAGVNFNDFKNSFNDFSWDNPFRVTDKIDGPVFGRMALAPDNKATTESLGGTFKIGSRSRLTADIAFGQLRQNEDPFIPFTTNTAIFVTQNDVSTGQPAVSVPLPAASLDGRIDTTALNAFFTTRLTDNLGLNARYRRYDYDNKTPRYRLEDGYVRFDSVWEEVPRISVPYGFTSDMFDAYATYGRGVFGVEAGWKYNKMARTFHETDDTTENVFRVAGDVRGGWFVLHAIGEFGSRDYDNYDAVRAEEASFLDPGPPANQTVLRRPDQAKRDLIRLGGTVELSTESGKVSGFASYIHTKFEYDQGAVPCQHVEDFSGQSAFCPGGTQAPLGLVDDKYDTFTLEADFAPTEKLSAYAFYSYENGDILQNGRQSGSTLNFSPADVWTSNITNKGNTLGAGVDFTVVPDKWFVSLFGRYQKVDGNNDLTLQPGFSTSIYNNASHPQCVGSSGPCAIAAFDDTEFATVDASLRYRIAKQWTAGGGVGYERFEIDDAQTGNTLNYMPSSFFLQADNRDYKAWVGYLNLTYSNQ